MFNYFPFSTSNRILLKMPDLLISSRCILLYSNWNSSFRSRFQQAVPTLSVFLHIWKYWQRCRGWMGGRGYVGGKRGTPGSVSLETAALATHKFQKNGNHHFDEQILLGIKKLFWFCRSKVLALNSRLNWWTCDSVWAPGDLGTTLGNWNLGNSCTGVAHTSCVQTSHMSGPVN